VDKEYNPTLSLIYLPHLDYCLQKYGPHDTKVIPVHLREVDKVVGELVMYYEQSHPNVKIVILSEYGISPVTEVVYPNKILREAGYITVRKENYGETLDCGASLAFAMADHQVAHVFVKDKKQIPLVKQLFSQTPGIEHVLDAADQDKYYNSGNPSRAGGAFHSQRSGDILLVSKPSAWFAYYYWKEESQAPDFARCVAIHRKPGYDPAEMFFRYKSTFLGMLYLFFKIFLVYVLHLRLTVDATPLHCDMIRGSHGALPKDDMFKPWYYC
jgi:predicted AlkP superfamily pyrophosphatase or phosphodiesterase